jgi:hypothetical protein
MEPGVKEKKSLRLIAEAGYRKVPSVKDDPRLVRYWQRWEGLGGPMDWFEFPHDLPPQFVWETIARCAVLGMR